MEKAIAQAHKYCSVPLCNSTTLSIKPKIFFEVPRNRITRKKWFKLMKKPPTRFQTTAFCCEDHFDLREDLSNWDQYTMKNSPPKLKFNAVPTKFDCQRQLKSKQPKKRRKQKAISQQQLIGIKTEEDAGHCNDEMDGVYIKQEIDKELFGLNEIKTERDRSPDTNADSTKGDEFRISENATEGIHVKEEPVDDFECEEQKIINLHEEVRDVNAKVTKSRSRYKKSCIVPMCCNNSKVTPGKLFFHVPKNNYIRDEWCEIMRRRITPKATAHCCEDHFNLIEDVANYWQYKIMKVIPRLKEGVLPSKFACQKRTESMIVLGGNSQDGRIVVKTSTARHQNQIYITGLQFATATTNDNPEGIYMKNKEQSVELLVLNEEQTEQSKEEFTSYTTMEIVEEQEQTYNTEEVANAENLKNESVQVLAEIEHHEEETILNFEVDVGNNQNSEEYPNLHNNEFPISAGCARYVNVVTAMSAFARTCPSTSYVYTVSPFISNTKPHCRWRVQYRCLEENSIVAGTDKHLEGLTKFVPFDVEILKKSVLGGPPKTAEVIYATRCSCVRKNYKCGILRR